MQASRGEEGHKTRMDESMATTDLTMAGLRESMSACKQRRGRSHGKDG